MKDIQNFIKSNKKKYDETWACLLLIKFNLLPSPFSSEWMKDRPDLQVNDYGIEITEAILKDEAEQRSIRQEMLKCESFTEVSNYHHEKNKNKPLQIRNTDFFGIRDQFKEYDESIIYNHIVNRIKDKNIKFYKYPNYVKYKQKGLFIKAQDEMIGSIVVFDDNAITEEIKKSIFDIVYLYLNNTLYVYDNNGKKNKIYNLKLSEINNISIDTLKSLYCPPELIKKLKEKIQY